MALSQILLLQTRINDPKNYKSKPAQPESKKSKILPDLTQLKNTFKAYSDL